MDAVAERRLLAVGAGVLVLGALWLMGVPQTRAPATSPQRMAAAADARVTAALATRPNDPRSVRGFVAACEESSEGHIPRLRELAHSDDPLVAGNAIAALGRLRALHRDPELSRLLAHPRPRVRHETILALGDSAAPEAILLLEPILVDVDPQARALAIAALGKLGAQRVLERLAVNRQADARDRALARAALRPGSVPAMLAITGDSYQ